MRGIQVLMSPRLESRQKLKESISGMRSVLLRLMGAGAFILMSIALPPPLSTAEMKLIVRGGVAVFGIPQASSANAVLVIEGVEACARVFNQCGRFRVLGESEVREAVRSAEQSHGGDARVFERAAAMLGVDLFVVVQANRTGELFFAEARVIALNPSYRRLARVVRVRSALVHNLALKIERSIARMHEEVPLQASVLKRFGNNTYLLDVGQWHGMRARRYRTEAHGEIEILHAGRYESVARVNAPLPDGGEPIIIGCYPETRRMIREIEQRLAENTINRYGMDSPLVGEGESRRRFIEGMCVVNMGGNVCLPIYGAFLSTYYLGFKEGSPDVNGLLLASASLLAQLMLPETVTGFRINYAPWVRDCDKTRGMRDLQVFLYATVPLTFTTAYLDQLAVQLKRTRVLPPFFIERDLTSLLLSALIPGGGLFYKGQRAAGWSYYFCEMALAGYGVYRFGDNKTGAYALYALGAVKLIEFIHAWFIPSSYDFYNQEIRPERNEVTLSLHTDFFNGDCLLGLAVTRRF